MDINDTTFEILCAVKATETKADRYVIAVDTDRCDLTVEQIQKHLADRMPLSNIEVIPLSEVSEHRIESLDLPPMSFTTTIVPKKRKLPRNERIPHLQRGGYKPYQQ